MRLFNAKRFLVVGLLILSTTLSSGCSAFFGEDGYVITSTDISKEQNGNTILTLHFSNDKEPMIITIPSGISGKEGVGIEKIEPTIKDGNVKIEIFFTDKSMESTVIEYPVINGKDGVGVKELNVDQDEFGNIVLKFIYTNGTESDLIKIPKGKDGNGIEKIETQYDKKNKVTQVNITFTNGTISTFEIADGKDGISIKSLEYDEINSNSDYYCIIVTYSNGLQTYLNLPRPKANTWHNGVFDNPDNSLGINGDFYINVTNGKVYLKENGFWQLKFSIKDDSDSNLKACSVIFADESEHSNLPVVVSGIKGSSLELNKIPVPEKREGKKFIGWYSARQTDTFDGIVNVGKFDDLTVLSKDALICYSWWENI